jgi:lysophospholipase L1-like esterase
MGGMSIALIAILELTLRIFFPQTLVPTPVRGEQFSLPHPDLGMRYVPGAVWRFQHPEYTVEYAINEDGFRGPASSQPHPSSPDGSLLLLGDSFTFGQGVPYERTWGAVTEGLLRQRGVRLDLINAGVQGMDTRSELLMLRELAPRYRPKVVVVGFLINDLYTNVSLDTNPRPEAGSAAWSRVREEVFVRAGGAQTFHLLQLARRIVTSNDALYTKLYLEAPGRGEFLRLPLSTRPRRQLAVTEQLLKQLAAECRALNVPLVVLSIPQQFQVLHRVTHGERAGDIDVAFYDRYFADLGRRAGFTWVATLDALAKAEEPARLYYRLDGHLSADGHAVVAKVLADALRPSILRSGPTTTRPRHGSPSLLSTADTFGQALDKDHRRGNSGAARALNTR